VKAFKSLESAAAPFLPPNIDTDQILPARFLHKPRSGGFGQYLFHDLRFDPNGAERPEFVLNHPCHRGARVVVANVSFGCGSSRENAVWALHDYGVEALIAPSFGDIFYTNCFKNGVLPVVLGAAAVADLFSRVESSPGYRLVVDLRRQVVRTPGGVELPFNVDRGNRHRLLHGLDEIALTMQSAERIRAYEATRRQQEPWLFPAVTLPGDAPPDTRRRSQ
jgi:3-isopropylmalate/(R)-2-methylmalate dehydratase small subunit